MIGSPSSGGHGGDFDAVVVGAGPAGSTAAWTLARAGVDVLLVDGSEFPRSKPCGEALSPGATPLLDEMGVLDRIRAEGANELRGFRLRTPEGRFVVAGFGPVRDGVPSEALALSRRHLDAVLLEAAIGAGAEFRAPVRVFDVEAPKPGSPRAPGIYPVRLCARDRSGRESTLGARWVIGADGLRSVVARRVMGVRRGRRDRLAVVGRYRLPAAGNRRTAASDAVRAPSRRLGELRLSSRGVLGAAPIEDELWTVAVVVARTRAARISDDPFAFFRAEVESYDFPPPAHIAELTEELQVTGPFDITPRAVTAPGVVLAGDAAGYFDPFTGQGIYRALVTGRRAATAVAAALDDPGPGRAAASRRDYAADLDELLLAGRRVQRLVDAVVSRPAAINPAGRLMAHRPGLLSLLLDVTGDRVPPGQLLRPSALAAAWRRRGSRS